MIVRKENVRKDVVSCNFCNKGKCDSKQTGLIYPYESVYVFEREGNGLCAAICEDCLNELNEKAKQQP